MSRLRISYGSEIIATVDGPREHALIPGVEPVSLARRQISELVARRDARRGSAPLPAGGLFDEDARKQLSLWDYGK